MEYAELIKIIEAGEDSTHQFKRDIITKDEIVKYFVAFSNARGGFLVIGVEDITGATIGIPKNDAEMFNQLLANIATDNVKPAINVITNNVLVDKDRVVVVIEVPKGISQPYMTNKSIIWVVNAGNIRQVTAREEMQRMLQAARLIYADEIIVNNMLIEDIDLPYFTKFLSEKKGMNINDLSISINQLLKNLNLADDINLNHTGALVFGTNIEAKLPTFRIKNISYPSNNIDNDNYLESLDAIGNIENVFQETLNFVLRNISYVQNNQSINSTGELEIPKIVFEELIANAIIHRDYFVQSPIRLFVFSNRIELISPGNLPNSLTIENIKNGVSNMKNPTLASYAKDIIPYRGMGTGIIRALKAFPYIQFKDDDERIQFTVIIERRNIS